MNVGIGVDGRKQRVGRQWKGDKWVTIQAVCKPQVGLVLADSGIYIQHLKDMGVYVKFRHTIKQRGKSREDKSIQSTIEVSVI